MKNTDLIKAVAERTEMTQSDVKAVLEAVKEVSIDALKTDKVVSIANLVTLKSVDVAAKSGQSFGKPWTKPAYTAVKAQVASKYKQIG